MDLSKFLFFIDSMNNKKLLSNVNFGIQIVVCSALETWLPQKVIFYITKWKKWMKLKYE